MENNTARKQVLNNLGDKEGNAGKAVVDFVEETVRETLRSNHEELVALVNKHNETFAKSLGLKADKADIDKLNARLKAAADALSGASAAHDTAARAANAESVQAEERAEAAQAATADAGAAVSDAKLTLESLEKRVKNLEDWRTEITPDLDWARRQRRLEEHDAARVPLISQPPAAEEHVAPQPVHPPTQVQPTVERRLAEREVVRTHFLDRTVNVRHWSGMQWACALVLAVVFMFWLGPIFSEWARTELQGQVWDWVTDVMRFLGWVIAALIGFCLGGVIGTLLDNAINSSSSAARREEREYHGQHVAHDDGHHNVRADELTHAR